MKDILETILSAEADAGRLRGAAGAGALPRRHRPQGRGRDVRGPGQPRQGPAPVPAPRRRADARARPRRGAGRRDGQRHQLQHRLDLDLRAGPDLRLPGALRPAEPAVEAARPALPRGRLRPGGRRAAHRTRRPRVEAGRRGRRALPLGRAGEPRRPQRHDARPGAADLGLRDELRRAGRARPGQVQPADAQAGPPHLGGGRGARTGQLHGVPPARLAQRRGDEAGRRRPDLGRQRRPRVLRDPVRPQRRRDPGVRRLQRREGRDRPLDGRRADHRPQPRAGEGYRFWKDETTQDPKEWQRLGKKIRELTGGDDVDIVFEHPGRETFGAWSSWRARAGPSSPAPPRAASCTSTTTATSG